MCCMSSSAMYIRASMPLNIHHFWLPFLPSANVTVCTEPRALVISKLDAVDVPTHFEGELAEKSETGCISKF
jgi:hypothetical protein